MSFHRGSFLGNAKGALGATGATGDAGAAGVPGVVWRSVWSAATAYAVDDAVAWDGSSFICISAHTNQEPPNATYWDVLAAAGVDGGEAVPYAQEIDDAGSGVLYVGSADPGTALNAADWQIKRITEVGPDISIEWADGDALFNNVWDNRAALTYN